jgi:plastocyanin
MKGVHLVRHRVSAAAGIGALAALLAVPGMAAAKTKSVSMGTPTSAAPKFQAVGADVNDFFPHGVTIRAGQKVKFVPSGFHSLNIPKKGGGPLALIAPTSTPANSTDANGAPFWFNGQPTLGFNPGLLTNNFGKKFTYTGKKGIESGLPAGAALKPITVKFKKAGRYTYFCDIHPGMKGTVTVKKRKAGIPSAKADRKRLKKQIARDLKIAKGLPKSTVAGNTVDVGVAGKHGVEFFGFLPGNLTVPVGTTVNFTMTPGSYEAHTATAGPGDINDPNSYIGALAKAFEAPVIDPRATYPSDPPNAGPAVLTPASHGNGFWNSGAIDANPSPLASSNSVTFGQAGTYTFYCLIHPFMKGTVTVQ